MTNYDIIPAEDATDATPSDSTHTERSWRLAVGVRSGLQTAVRLGHD